MVMIENSVAGSLMLAAFEPSDESSMRDVREGPFYHNQSPLHSFDASAASESMDQFSV